MKRRMPGRSSGLRGCCPSQTLLAAVACFLIVGVGAPGAAAAGEKKAPVKVKDEDPVHLVMEQYEAACNEIRSAQIDRPKRLQFYRDWQDRLLEVTKANPKSPYTRSASAKLLGIANSLGDSQAALKLAEQLAALSDDPAGKLQSYGEMGEISRGQFYRTKNLADAESAIGYFAKAKAAYQSLPAERQQAGEHRDRYVINLCMLAGLYGTGKEDHSAAASVFREIREVFASAPPGSRLATLGYDFEYAASSEMTEWLRLKDAVKAEAALELLAGRTGMRWPPAYYAHIFAATRFPQGGEEFQGFVERWLAAKAPDAWTPFLRFYLARDYFNHRQYDKSLPILIDLKDNYADVLLKADEPVIQTGSGGFYAETLHCLAFIYSELGDRPRAKALANEMKELVPKDVRLPSLMDRVATLPNSDPPPPPSPAPGWIITVNLLVLAVAVAVIAVVRWRRLIRKRL